MSNKSIEQYPNAYDLMAIKETQKILESYLCSAEWNYKFQKLILEEKKRMILDICLEIDLKK